MKTTVRINQKHTVKSGKPRWEIDAHWGGKRIRKLIPYSETGTLKERDVEKRAVRWLEKKLAQPQSSPVVGKGPTLQDIYNSYLKKLQATPGISPNTIRNWDDIVKSFIRLLGNVDITSITPASFRKLDSNGWSTETCDTRKTKLLALLKHAREEMQLPDVPSIKRKDVHKHVPKKHLDRKDYYSESQLINLLKAAESIHPLMAALVCLGSYGGLRIGEILGLQWDDIDWELKQIHIKRQRYIIDNALVSSIPKSGSSGVIPLTAPVEKALLTLRQDAQLLECSPYVLTAFDFRLYRPRYSNINGRIRRWMLKITRAANKLDPTIKPSGKLHILRHTGLSLLAQKTDGNVLAVQKLARHSKLGTSQIYIHGDYHQQIQDAFG